ncbi:MAG: helix-hairpin-helix domain-containing protein [Chloroflexi bacterium]|nr:helix-hairpin-helix domain-containing protein [Chloroflexota bacterium]
MSRSDRIMIAAGGGALVLALAAGWLAFAPVEADSTDLASGGLALPTMQSASAAPTTDSAVSGTIVVDVQGAVLEPGVRQLPAGSRVAEAIAASGGYASDADLATAAASMNLAQALADGEQVRVPRIGEASHVAGGTGGAVPSAASVDGGGGGVVGGGGGVVGGGGGGVVGGGGGGGLVNLNTATPEELEALPGIGPVTVQKIVAARQEQPFASLDDAVQRGVIHRGQLEDIQGVATAG